MTLALTDVPDELVQAIRDGQCVLFAGGGIAKGAGYPTFIDLLYEVAAFTAKARPELLSEAVAKQLQHRPGDADFIASYLEDLQEPSELAATVSKVLGERRAHLHETHYALAALPFCGVLDATIGDVVEVTFAERLAKGRSSVVSWSDPAPLESALQQEHFFVLKLSGFVRPVETAGVLLSSRSFDAALRDNVELAKSLSYLLVNRTVLFVGISPQSIERLLRALPSSSARAHFALVAEGYDDGLRYDMLRKRHGIECIVYKPDSDHTLAARYLKELVERHSRLASASAATRFEASTLTHVRLQNIGPFESIELRAVEGWNVLLGNNSCGKTTILRAIALGLCGNDSEVQSHVSGMLRAGTQSGSIELTIGGRSFQTDLHRGANEQVHVRSPSLTPLQIGRQVILGFPAMRGVPLQALNGPSAFANPKPVIGDVLPLLIGGVDRRVDDMRQWIINSFVSCDSSGAELVAERSRRALDVFFGVVSELVPGIDLAFDEVDRTTWEVWVRTVDGRVPLRSVSQGTTSVFGWVGVLVQRMFELHPLSSDPTEESAIVLVDEIDAHMHPSWQQKLLGAFRRRFPKVQLIASTHSPLIVGGLDANEVTVLRRRQPPPGIVVETLPNSFRGWRADQILTSDAFNLETSVTARPDGWDEYHRLLGIDPRSSEEQEALLRLEKQLQAQIPSSGESLRERERLRRALDILRDGAGQVAPSVSGTLSNSDEVEE